MQRGMRGWDWEPEEEASGFEEARIMVWTGLPSDFESGAYRHAGVGYGGLPEPEPASHVGRGPRGWQRRDEWVREDVCEQLAADPEVDAGAIEVAVDAGEVTLSGSVPERWMKRAAEDDAATVPGVREVHVRLRVAPQAGGELGT